MGQQALEQLVVVAVMIFAIVGLVGMRWLMNSRVSRETVRDIEEQNKSRYKDAKSSMSQSSSRLATPVAPLAGASRYSGFGGTTAHSATPRSPRLAQLARVDPAFSELDFLEFVVELYTWAHRLRPKRDYIGLSAFLSPAARDTFLSGLAGLDSVEDIHVGATRTTRVYADSEWSSIEVEIQASMVERIKEEFQKVYRTASWRFRRRSSVGSPLRAQLLALGCPNCGSTEPIGEHRDCPDCGEPRGGPEVHWEVAGIGNMHRNPQPSPPKGLPLGPPGYPAPTGQDLINKMAAWDEAHPDMPLTQVNEELCTWLRRALSVEGPTLSGPLGRRLDWEERRLADSDVGRKTSAGNIKFAELIDITDDATHDFIEARMVLDVMLVIDDGKTTPPTQLPVRKLEFTISRSKDGGDWYPMDLRWNAEEDDETAF